MQNLFDDFIPDFPETRLIVLIGISGSGKSTWVKSQFHDTQVLSSDEMRGVLTDDTENQKCSVDVFPVLENLANLRLKYQRPVVIDATNLKRSTRKIWLDLARKYHVPAVAIFVDTPTSSCIERQHSRDRRVPIDVVQHQALALNGLEQNLKSEAWNAILRVTPKATKNSQAGVNNTKIEFIVPWEKPAIVSYGTRGVRVSHQNIDIIGDVHGCYEELVELLAKLGWQRESEDDLWSHPMIGFSFSWVI